ncbi:hypothetical protein F7R02_26235, partial [Xanthomonas cissicola]
LNRIGTRNAEAWLLRLKFADYQAQIMERFAALTNTLASVLRNAEAWLLRLKFADYQAQIMERFAALTNTLASVLRKAKARMG